MLGKIFGLFKSSNNTVSLKETLENLKLVGTLYKKTVGKKRELLSDECSLYMNIMNEKTFDYNLNAYNEEYQFQKGMINIKTNINLNSIDSWESLTYPVTNDLGLKCCSENGRYALIWEYQRQFYIFYLLTDEMNTKNKDNFINTLVTLIASYESEVDYQKALTFEENKDYILNLDVIENVDQFLEENYSKFYGLGEEPTEEHKKINIDDITKKFDNMALKQLDFLNSFPNAVNLFTGKGTLYKYDRLKDDLIAVSSDSKLGIYKVQSFNYYLVVDDASNKTLSCSAMSQEINLLTNRKENLIMWLSRESMNPDVEPTAYNFVFYDEDKIDTLRKIYAKTQYESSSLSKYEDLNAEDQKWLENENMPDEEILDEDIKEVEMEMSNEFQESTSDQLNKVTAQAYLHDRTFVVRENNTIGVYKTDEEDVLTHLANLPAVTKYEDKDIDITNAQMFYSDTNMILLDKKNPNTAFRYDLGKGKIVEEWSAEGMKKIEAVTHEKKFDQMTDNPLLHGVNSNTLFTMDARVNKKNKVVATKSYKTNPKMHCIKTTDFGGIATGSLNGEIRLYSQVGKNAKTLLTCFGDAINDIDVTADGKYLLATCDKYLILIPTNCKGEKNGFNTQMGKEKPNPRTLKIKPIDLNKYGLDKFSFTPAKFNVNKIDGETNIIASLGDYIIIWNFTKVKKGILDDYKIRKVNQKVIENQFKFNRNQVVVTMENKLRIQNQLFLDK